MTASGEQPEEKEEVEDGSAPPGLDRYISRPGFDRLRAEQAALRHEERPRVVEIVSWAAGNGDRSENGDYLYGKRRLREIDRRLRFLDRRIRTAIVVGAGVGVEAGQVRFGATVTYAGVADDRARTVTIVGADEADLTRGEVSLVSPIGRALLGARVGDEVRLVRPAGIEVLEVLAIGGTEASGPDS